MGSRVAYLSVDDITSSYAARWQYYKDGRPPSGHAGFRNQWCEPLESLISVGHGVSFFGSGGSGQVDRWRWSTKDWDQPNKPNPADHMTWRSQYGQQTSATEVYYSPHCVDPVTGEIYAATGTTFEKWSPTTFAWSRLARGWPSQFDWPRASAMTVAKARGKIYMVRYVKWNVFMLLTYTVAANSWVTAAITGIGTPFDTGLTYGGLIYEETRDLLIWMNGIPQLYEIDPDTAMATRIRPTGTSPATQYRAEGQAGVFNRFQYAPELGGCVFASGADPKGQPADACSMFFLPTA